MWTKEQIPKLNKRIGAAVLSVCVMLSSVIIPPTEVKADDKVLTLKAAQELIIKNSEKIEGLEGQVLTKEAAYKSAVKSITLKEKNMRTFRWSPLLSFHFPETPDFSEAAQFRLKPIQASSQVDIAKHALADQYFAEYETVYKDFVTIVSLEQKLEFNQQRLDLMQDTLDKNKARWLMGEASEQDIKNMENSVKSLDKAISADSRDLLNAKKSLKKDLDLDVTTGYSFENPFVKTDIPRSALPALVESTLDNDHAYYIACENATIAYQTLKTDASLVKSFYKRSDYNIIDSYVNAALSGQDFSQKAFKKAYESFLIAIDRYWPGDKKIFWFIKIPFDWLRGDLDGVRYIEDDPHALFEAALTYRDALNEKKAMCNELTKQVEDTYNNVAAMRNSYDSLVEQVDDASEQMKKDAILNKVGKLTYDEFSSSQESYNNLQQDMLKALADYSQTLYEFDRLTCGAVSAYLNGTGAAMFAVGSGTSTISDEEAKGANYYISLLVSQNIFELFVNIPEDLDIGATHFALIVDGVQIGDKVEITGKLRHLGLLLDDISSAKIRLYKGDDVICDCDIDPQAYSGALNIITGFNVESAENTDMGTYSVDTSAGISKLTMKLDAGQKAKYFKIKTDENKYLGGDDSFNSVSDVFIYAGVLSGSLDKLTIEYYDDGKGHLYDGYFDSSKGKLKKLTE